LEKIFHILNGDCLAEQLKETSIKSGVIIYREALISGDIKANSLEDFWKLRAQFISQDYGINKEVYYEKFQQKFGMYGYGDLQVKKMYDKVLKQ